MPNTDPISSVRPSASVLGIPSFGSLPREIPSVNDTLGIADDGSGAANWTPERPVLTFPDDLPPPERIGQMSEYRLLAATEESRKLGNSIMETLGTRLKGVKQKIREISTESIEKLKENARRVADSSFWSVLKKIATA